MYRKNQFCNTYLLALILILFLAEEQSTSLLNIAITARVKKIFTEKCSKLVKETFLS